jgi:geranylgeranyl pyrophosphate synthase
MDRTTFIERSVEVFLSNHVSDAEIRECLLYASVGGKKIRSHIYLEILEQLLVRRNGIGERVSDLMRSGFLYIELVHSASLILDDMPHMDNDQTRRGRPSVHVKYGKAKSQLSAFVLIQLAHQQLATVLTQLYGQEHHLTAEQYAQTQVFLEQQRCDFLGERGLAGGQYLDLFRMKSGRLEDYLLMIEYKTARLFELSFITPYVLACSDQVLRSQDFDSFRKMGFHFGQLFQLLDDLEDHDPMFSTGNNILDYINRKEAWKMISDCHQKCEDIAGELGLNLDHLWKLMGDKLSDLQLAKDKTVDTKI